MRSSKTLGSLPYHGNASALIAYRGAPLHLVPSLNKVSDLIPPHVLDGLVLRSSLVQSWLLKKIEKM